MANPKVPAAAPAAAPEAKPVNVQAILDTAAETRTAELEGLTGVSRREPSSETPAAPATPAAGTPPAAEAFDFTAEWNKLPENLRDAAYTNFYNAYNQTLVQQYGDMLPLVERANSDPNLRATLAAAAQDPELLTYLADPDARKQIKKLTNKELREFLFGDATTTYEKYQTPSKPAVDPVESLRSEFEAERNVTRHDEYIKARQQEVFALKNSYGFNDSQLAHVVGVSEQRFENAALRAGIRTDEPGWAGKAIRAGVKPPSYSEAGGQYAEIVGRTPPPAAPATSSSAAPVPQAPRDATESKAAGLRALQAVKSKNPALQGRSK